MSLISRLPSGGGKKSLILPKNIALLNVLPTSSTVKLMWSIPTDSEIEIEYFNVYYCMADVKPTSLKSFTKYATLPSDATECTVTGLTDNRNYYFVVESVSVEGYENASMLGVNNSMPTAVKIVAIDKKGNAYYSINGETFNLSPTTLSTNYEYKIAYGLDRYVCVDLKGRSYYSLDAENWVSMTGLSASYYFRDVAFGNGKFVTVCQYGGQHYYSTDGVKWVNNGTISGGSGDNYSSLVYGNDRFVTVGDDGISYYSLDGLEWFEMTGLGNRYYEAVAYGNGMFLTIGQDSAYISTDGKTWTQTTQVDSGNQIYGLTFSGDRFIAVGESGVSYYSLDGRNWVAMSGITSGATLYDVAACGDRVVAVGDEGCAYYSLDGETWFEMSGISSTSVLEGVCANV